MTPRPDVDPRGNEMYPLQELLFPGPALRAPPGARGVLCAWHGHSCIVMSEEHPKAGMRRPVLS